MPQIKTSTEVCDYPGASGCHTYGTKSNGRDDRKDVDQNLDLGIRKAMENQKRLSIDTIPFS